MESNNATRRVWQIVGLAIAVADVNDANEVDADDNG